VRLADAEMAVALLGQIHDLRTCHQVARPTTPC
jgi:hypothetical protein